MHNIVEAEDTSKGKVREFVLLSAPMKKAGQPTYLSKYKDSLIVPPYYIEGDHGLPLEINSLS